MFNGIWYGCHVRLSVYFMDSSNMKHSKKNNNKILMPKLDNDIIFCSIQSLLPSVEENQTRFWRSYDYPVKSTLCCHKQDTKREKKTILLKNNKESLFTIQAYTTNSTITRFTTTNQFKQNLIADWHSRNMALSLPILAPLLNATVQYKTHIEKDLFPRKFWIRDLTMP